MVYNKFSPSPPTQFIIGMTRSLKNKKIIFFDADGTLWYPIKTKHTILPHWLYLDKNIKDHRPHLMLIPGVKDTLVRLRKKGIITIILSTHPHEIDEAYAILNKKVEHFTLKDLFTEVHATREHYNSKGEYIIEILRRLKIPKTKAVMVGDNYKYDYKSARNVGVDALLVQSVYMKRDKRLKVIKNIEDILNII